MSTTVKPEKRDSETYQRMSTTVKPEKRDSEKYQRMSTTVKPEKRDSEKVSEKMNRVVDAHIRTVLEEIFIANVIHHYNRKQKAIRDKEDEVGKWAGAAILKRPRNR